MTPVTFILCLLAMVSIGGTIMGCDMLRDRLDPPTRFLGGVTLGCSLLLAAMIYLVVTA